MSRKDPRRRLTVPMTPEDLDHLRALAEGKSLGDALRRVASQSLCDLPQDLNVPLPVDARRLPVQLPKRDLQRLDHVARAWGQNRDYVLYQLITADRAAGSKI